MADMVEESVIDSPASIEAPVQTVFVPHQGKTVRQRLASGVAYNFIAAAFAQGSTFIANVLLSRLLGKSLFGEYSVVQVTLATIANASLLSMSSVTNKYVAEFRSKDRELASRALTLCSSISTSMGLLGLLGTALLSNVIAASIMRDPRLGIPLALGSIFVFAQNRALLFSAFLAGLEEYRRYAIAAVWSGIAYVVAVYSGASIGGVNGAALGLSIAATIFWIALWWMGRKAIQEHGLTRIKHFDAFEKDLLIRFAVPAVVCGYVLLPCGWLLPTFLYRQWGADESALYADATSFRLLVLAFPLVLSSVGLSVLNNTMGTKDYALTHRITTAVLVGFTTLMLLIIAVFGREILGIFGAHYSPAYPVLLVLAPSAVFEAFSTAMRNRINAQRLMWGWLLAVIVPWQASTMIAMFYFVPRYAAVGAAYSYLIGTIVYAACSWALCVRARPLEQDSGAV